MTDYRSLVNELVEYYADIPSQIAGYDDFYSRNHLYVSNPRLCNMVSEAVFMRNDLEQIRIGMAQGQPVQVPGTSEDRSLERLKQIVEIVESLTTQGHLRTAEEFLGKMLPGMTLAKLQSALTPDTGYR